ncbi:F-box domain containing protein [Parasponia andersonii]|uniref:F-box domain containing protein n=1 Tax=Parasponia andersonii TaxID=3476 RepID=A0A2P5BC73_PARAD|nr:F-box domain containing protein [Parasponia andersonii]
MNFEVAELITKAFISTYMKLVAEKKTTSRIPPRTDFFLHESIIIEILSRLEPKSVMRFKCVCKHWQYRISYDPIIRDMPLRLKVPCILFGPRYATRPSPAMFSSCGFGVNISSLRLADPLESGTSLVVEGSDNGIVCLSEFSTKTVIYLWNPRTREVKKLPSPKYSPLWESSKFRLGLGYDPLTNDFKVVKVCRYDLREDNLGLFHGTDNRVYIYSLRSNSWKRI